VGEIAEGRGESVMENPAIFVVVPAFDEAAVLRETVRPLLDAGYIVVVVDDGSEDDPATSLQGLPVVMVRHAVNLGQGAALQTGTEYALRCGAGIIVHFDADGQHSADGIPALIEPIRNGRADVVLGSRFLRPEDAARTPRAKRLLLSAGIAVSWLFTGLWLSDTHNGFRALSQDAARTIELRENGFAHATEILGQIRRKRLRFVEIPAPVRYSSYSRRKGQSFWNSFNIVIDLVLEKLFR
jgi:polyprenyl-phospho-N-acetylgalactosaminyl synthase